MFDQDSYKQEFPEVQTQPGDLFHNFEIKNWNFSPRLYKILGFSAVFNILALVVIGSSGMLTTRGCESPFVGRVCQVLDTVYVGSLIFGTEAEYADVDYTKTELEDAEVTFVDVTGVTPPLNYPEGYFQLANPEQQFANMTDASLPPGFVAPGIPYSNPTIGGSGLINTPPVKAQNNPNAVVGDLPTGSPLGDPSDNPTLPGKRKGGRGGKVPESGTTADANTDPNNPTTANNNTNQTTAQNAEEGGKEDEWGVVINKRPLREEGIETLEKLDAAKVKLDTPFKVVISGTVGLAKDGKTVVLKNPKPVVTNPPTKNDPVMEKFVQDWILAVGDAGWFGHLTRLADPKPKTLVITVEQNDTDLIASVKADQPTEEKANSMQSSLSFFLGTAKALSSGDNRSFLEKASVTAEGKNFVLNFKIPKGEVKDMVMRKLAEQKEKATKPEANAVLRPDNSTAKK